MDKDQLIKNLSVPTGVIDAVIDTDTYNEVDDQFALAYMIKSTEKINLKAIYAAPFHNGNSDSPSNGMHKSYDEIMKILDLMEEEKYKNSVFHGSENYLKDEETPEKSDAAEDLIKRARQYSPEKPLYVIAIGAITNIASALLMAPDIAENIVVVWLGGHDMEGRECEEFNMMQDIAGARVLFKSPAPVIQLPCLGVVSGFNISEPELKQWFSGKNKLCDYLANIVIADQNKHSQGKPWSRIIWDVTTVGWILNDGGRFMNTTIRPCAMPGYDKKSDILPDSKLIGYVNQIWRDALLEDLINKLTK